MTSFTFLKSWLNLLFFSGDSMIWKARNFGDRELFQSAQNIKTPSCDQLHTVRNHG